MPGRQRRGSPGPVILLAIAIVAAAYQLFAIVACLMQRSPESGRKRSKVRIQSPASVLKPLYGADPGLREALRSHSILDGEFELLCGVHSLDDPAVAVAREFPGVRVIECHTNTPNGKAGVLIDLAAAAHYSILVVNDADVRVEPDYLARVTAPLSDPRVGLVTCLYRAEGDTLAALFEGLGVSTEFAPSALVARAIGVNEFAFGVTLAFRKVDLERIGGFEAFADYLADDYQLGHRLHALGLKCVLAGAIVDTRSGGGWRDVWRHQVRWARTVRVSKFFGYLGLPVTYATLWSFAAAASGRWAIAAMLIAVRMIMAITAGWFLMRSRDVLRLWFLIPLRDLFSVAVWVTGLFGSSVEWRGQRLPLDRLGRIR